MMLAVIPLSLPPRLPLAISLHDQGCGRLPIGLHLLGRRSPSAPPSARIGQQFRREAVVKRPRAAYQIRALVYVKQSSRGTRSRPWVVNRCQSPSA